MSEEFKAGDVVELKSGGPRMTVSQTGEHAMSGRFMIWCDWFDGKKKVSDSFPPETLKLSGT
jgi:uncharacterized protein YodC (DUF2158 family)